MSITMSIKYTFLVSLFVIHSSLMSNIFADTPKLYSQSDIKERLDSNNYQKHVTIIKDLELNKQTADLVNYAKTLHSNSNMDPYIKESLLEESINAISQSPETLSATLLLKELSNYQAIAKIELSDGPHRMQVNANSVASLAKLALENWDTITLSKSFSAAINSGAYENFQDYPITNKRIWLNAAKSAINNADKIALNQFLENLVNKKVIAKTQTNTLMLHFLVSKKLNNVSGMQSSLGALAANINSQVFALQELRQLDIRENLDVFRIATQHAYLNSYALSSLGTIANSTPEALDLLLSQLKDQKNGGAAAFALKKVDINTLSDHATKELKSSNDELYQKRLLLSLKLHPEGNTFLHNILGSNTLPASIQQEVSTWLN